MKKIDDTTFQRMRESYSSKKTLKIKNAGDSKKTKKTKKKRSEPSQDAPLVGVSGPGCEGSGSADPIVIPDAPLCSDVVHDAPVRSDVLPPVPPEPEGASEADQPLKRARVDRSSKSQPAASRPSSSLEGGSSVPHPLGQGLVRDLLIPPEGCSYSTATLDSLRYRGVDLSPFITERLALQKDIDDNFALLNKCGGMKWGKMVVSDLTRVLVDALSLLPLISKQEKALAKYQKFDLEKATHLQSELDQARRDLAKYQGFDPEEANRLRSELGQARKEFSLLQGSLDRAIGAADILKGEIEKIRSVKESQDARLDQLEVEKGKLLGVISEKEVLITSLQEDSSSQKKMVEEARSAERLAREELKESDANAYSMFIRGFREAQAQIIHFNPSLQIDTSKLSAHSQTRFAPSEDEEDSGSESESEGRGE